MNGSSPSRARHRASSFRRFGWVMVVAITLLALFPGARTALGHTLDVSLTCERSDLKVWLTSFNATKGDANSVAVSIDGVPVDGSPFAFGERFVRSWPITDLTVPHTATVVVSAWEDPDGSKGWSRTFNLEMPACINPTPTPTVEPTPTPTVEPTPTPTVEPTPTPTVEPTPTPTVEPTPTPTPEALLVVLKVIDVDGDIETTDDWFEAPGWSFGIDVANGAADPTSGVTDADGVIEFPITPGEGGASVDVAETLLADYEFVDAACAPLDDEVNPEGMQVQALADLLPGIARGTVGDGEVSGVAVADGETVLCLFVNTSGEVQEATGTPKVTPPPTATLPTTSGTPGDGWRFALLGLAGLLGMVLVLTPAAPTRIRRRR